jgi:hypothetical protein
MSQMIGETLIERGLINHEQLERALKLQLMHGGHLGTCLIEMGFVREESLGRLLADIFNVTCAGPRDFIGLPDHLLRRIPEHLVVKHRAIPIQFEKDVLSVALVNPLDLHALDDLAFATNYRIVPCAAPEIRILQAMEIYYDVPRSRRYISIIARLDQSLTQQQRPTASDLQPATSTLDHENGVSNGGTDMPGLAIEEDDPVDRSVSENSGPQARLADLLCDANNKEMLARAVLDYAALKAKHGMLFIAKKSRLRLWDWIGLEIAPEAARHLDLDLVSEPLFELLAGDEWYRGPIPEKARYQRLFELLQITVPAEMLLMPVHLNDRLVSILYCDGGPVDPIVGETGEFRDLVRKFQIALHMLLLKSRIRQH